KQLAEEVGVPVERLVSRLADAGVSATGADDLLSDDDKLLLLRHLSAGKSQPGKLGTRRGSVSLQRRSKSDLKVNTGRSGTSGRTVNVEVRKRRTYVNKRQQEADEAAQKAAEETKLAAAETQRQREEAERAESEQREAEVAETKRKQEEDARVEAENEARRKAEADAVREAQEQAKKDALERSRAKRDDTVDSARSRARENLRR